MKKRLILCLAFTLLIYLSHAQNRDFVLKGQIEGIQKEILYLYKDTGENRELMDSVITQNGAFQFFGKIAQSIAVELQLSKFRRTRFFISPGEMNLLLPLNQLKYGFVTGILHGSKAQDRFEDYQSKLHQNQLHLHKISKELELPEVKGDSIQTANFLSQYKKLDSFKQTYFYKYASSPVIPYLIYQDFFKSKCSITDIKDYLTTLNIANPKGLYVRNLNKRVRMIEQLRVGAQFPNINARTLNDDVFSLQEEKGNTILLYFWRAWTEENNQKYLEELKKLTIAFPKLRIVSIIRNSSFNRIPIPETDLNERWKPKPMHLLNITEIESLDKSLEIVRYLDRRFHVFIIDPEGKIEYHQDHFDPKLLQSELSKQLSNKR
ncbi:DUF4369 domain-containing protein [Ancylomarina longa]|uniref:DUF4369 domain-containing protein n=1 Tax=Ancylomarina longa TaxID=2487017 RepID=A0A434AXZ6_9BACT|nr:DUF4369 domain-containing protein [Ancylomarina longa]RUT79427.1 DUF4369 domain-containing protein [Ancylomarina longa]